MMDDLERRYEACTAQRTMLLGEIDRLTAQRDALLDACKSAIPWLDRDGPTWVYEKLRAAVEAAEKG